MSDVVAPAPFEEWRFCAQATIFCASILTLILFSGLSSRIGPPAKAGSGIGVLRQLGLDLGVIAGYAIGFGVALSSAVAGVDAVIGPVGAAVARIVAWLPFAAGVLHLVANVCRIFLRARSHPAATSWGLLPWAVRVLSIARSWLLRACVGWAALVLWPLLVP